MVSEWCPINQKSESEVNDAEILRFGAPKGISDVKRGPSRKLYGNRREKRSIEPRNEEDHITKKRNAQPRPKRVSRQQSDQSSDPVWLKYASKEYASRWKARHYTDISQDLPRTKPKQPATEESKLVDCLHAQPEATNKASIEALKFGKTARAALRSGWPALATAPSAVEPERSSDPGINAILVSNPPSGPQFDPPQSAQGTVDESCVVKHEASDNVHTLGPATLSTKDLDTIVTDESPLTSYSCHASQETEQAMQLLAEQTNFNENYGCSEEHELSDQLFNDAAIEDDLPDWLGNNQTSKEGVASQIDTEINILPKHTAQNSPPASQSSCTLTHVSGNPRKIRPNERLEVNQSENEFPDSDFEISLMGFPASKEVEMNTPRTSPPDPTTPKPRYLSSDIITSNKSSRLPLTPEVAHEVQFSSKGEPIPFLRSPFPTPILDRSPILGLTNRTVLRVCFRVGEALNATCQASRNHTDAIIELYARVIESSREGYKQSFSFADLFTDNPPYLKGVYGMWKGVGLWDHDSAVFIGEEGKGKMCRVLGRIKREKGKGYEMNVLSVWECGWEDVGIAKGIATS